MKKSSKKTKTQKSAAKSAALETQMPDLVSALMKLTERLDAVERKMDVVINRVSNSPAQQSQRPQHHQQQHQPSHNRPQHPQFSQPRYNSEPNFNRAPQPQHSHSQHQNQNRQGGKPMFQAVCVECKKNCEVPFRPSGERPTYCKECYAKRKNGNHSQQQQPQQNSSGFQNMEKRQLKVVSNGVGKTTISEMVPVAPRAAAPKKVSKPAKKARK